MRTKSGFHTFESSQRQMGRKLHGLLEVGRTPLIGIAETLHRSCLIAASIALLLGLAAGSAHAQWTQLGADIDGEVAGDQAFVVAISEDGSRLAVGARYHASEAGQVRAFDWNGSSWIQSAQDIFGEVTGDWTGTAIALSADGTRIAVGSSLHNGIADNSGCVRVFDRDGIGWVQVGDTIEGAGETAYAGAAVALSADGQRLAVGAWGYDGTYGTDSGYVRVYQVYGVIPGGYEWQQIGQAVEGDSSFVRLGWSVALSADGSRLAVGGPNADPPGESAGLVEVYSYNHNDDVWYQLGSDIHSADGDQVGKSVALSAAGSRLAVGAPFADANGIDSGLARVYQFQGFPIYDWLQVGTDIPGENPGDQAGMAVALSANGSRVAVGAPLHDHGFPFTAVSYTHLTLPTN